MMRARGALSLLALGFGALFVVIAGALVFGVRGGAGSDVTDDTAADTTTTEGTRRTSGSTVVAPVVRGSLEGPAIVVSAAVPYGTPAPVVDRLSSRSVIDITASGFAPSATGIVQQCGTGGCANAFPVIFDAKGEARFQYLVREDFARAWNSLSTCRAEATPCVVKVTASEQTAHFTTVFRDAAPPARRVTLTPGSGGLVDGAPVRITATGFAPGEWVQAMLCAAPDTFGSTRCGAPGPVAQFTIRSDGTGVTTLVLREGRVGSGGARCGRGAQPCAVVVVDVRGTVPGAIRAFSFATGPGANYDGDRLAIGLVVALVLLALAAFLVRTTDWRKPSEADTPELDRVTLPD
jgi:hypothetical protein